jgi:hypothetical protein
MYMRISDGIMDPLYTTSLVVDGGQGQDHVIFCSCDVVVLTEGVIEMTRDLVAAQRPEINRDFILMNATHTHSGCNLRDTPEKSPDPNTCEPMRYRKALSNYNSVKNRNETIRRRYTRQDQFPVEDIQVHILRIGDIAFATNKFELYHDFMHRVQARSPFLQTFVIQLAGHETGTYLTTKRAEANKGCSASLFCNWIYHEGGQDWVESVLETRNELHEKE